MPQYTNRLQEAISAAQSLALGNDQQYIEPVHLFSALINQEGEVYEENFPYPGRFGRRTTFVGGPGRYILAIYGPEGPDGYDFRYWDVIEIEEVNN